MGRFSVSQGEIGKKQMMIDNEQLRRSGFFPQLINKTTGSLRTIAAQAMVRLAGYF
jgi:hypothetical protein